MIKLKERKNKSLTKSIIAIMLNLGVVFHWMREILLTIYYMLNKVPKYKRQISPYPILNKRQPKLSYFRTWGCLGYVWIPNHKILKLTNRSYACVFIGFFFVFLQVYRFYDVNTIVLMKLNDVNFQEDKLCSLVTFQWSGVMNTLNK